MNWLDMRTVLLGYWVTSIICLVVVAILWFRYRRRFEGLTFWLADYALQFASLLMALTRGFAPEWIAIMTSPPAIVVGMVLFFIGLERFTGKRGPQIHNWVLLGVYMLAQGYFGLVQPSLTARNILLSAFLVVIGSQCAWLLLRRVDPAMRPFTLGVGYAFVAISITSAIRIVVDAIRPVGQDFLRSPDRDTVFLFLFQFLNIILAFALSLMVSRLLMESDRARRDKAEELVASEERFRSIYDNAPIGIFRASADGTLTMANGALVDMFGASDASGLEGTNLCRDHCQRGMELGSCLPLHASDASPYVHEAEWRRCGGEAFTVKVYAKAVVPSGGGATYFEGTVEDITAVRSAQDRLRTLDAAIEAMDLGFCISDPENRILYANPAEAHMHGYTVENLLGRDAQDLGPESQRHDRTLDATRTPLIFRREGLNRRADGTLFPAFLTSLPVYDADGVPFCTITTCQDLTEAKRRDTQLQEALRDAAVGKLAAVVAHQVNTPLAAMKTRLEMLREDAGEDETARKSLDIVMKQVDRVAQTVRALLGFVRQRSVGEEFTSIQGVITSVLRLFESALQSKGIHLDVTLPSEALRVQGNTADLQEVFLNLFENYREALGGENRISVTARTMAGSVEVRLEDDGPGLGDDPERVFEPFYTTKSQGTGLGLPICRNICTACGGTLVAENRTREEGGGARFIITLPFAARETPPEENP